MKGGVLGEGLLEVHAAGCGARDARVVPRLNGMLVNVDCEDADCAYWRWV